MSRLDAMLGLEPMRPVRVRPFDPRGQIAFVRSREGWEAIRRVVVPAARIRYRRVMRKYGVRYPDPSTTVVAYLGFWLGQPAPMGLKMVMRLADEVHGLETTRGATEAAIAVLSDEFVIARVGAMTANPYDPPFWRLLI